MQTRNKQDGIKVIELVKIVYMACNDPGIRMGYIRGNVLILLTLAKYYTAMQITVITYICTTVPFAICLFAFPRTWNITLIQY